MSGGEVEEAKVEGEGEKAAEAPKKSNLLLIIIIAVVVLAGGAAAFLFLTPAGQHLLGKGEKKEEKKHEQVTYFSMPELIVNLTTTGKRTPFLRIVMKLELADPEAQKVIEEIKPRIIDSFQVYLRELRMDDLEGSAGVQRLREELIKRVNALAAPVQVRDVLFETLLVQ